jgi:NAD(P)-dependent dehydrogenase (short-subunit alcohol dehydrogenase family)
MSTNIDGKVVVLTGGSAGLGEDAARHLSARGGEHNAGDHRVAQFAGRPFLWRSRARIKRSDSTFNLVNRDLLKSLNQCRASLSNGQNLQSVANLEYCDGTRSNGRPTLLVEPFGALEGLNTLVVG